MALSFLPSSGEAADRSSVSHKNRPVESASRVDKAPGGYTALGFQLYALESSRSISARATGSSNFFGIRGRENVAERPKP